MIAKQLKMIIIVLTLKKKQGNYFPDVMPLKPIKAVIMGNKS